jgi:hypothetical protein
MTCHVIYTTAVLNDAATYFQYKDKSLWSGAPRGTGWRLALPWAVRYATHPTAVGGFSFIEWAKGSIFFPAQSSDVLEKEVFRLRHGCVSGYSSGSIAGIGLLGSSRASYGANKLEGNGRKQAALATTCWICVFCRPRNRHPILP